jgi:ABC-type microcin C transport system duplicated ATPase subunit YejF
MDAGEIVETGGVRSVFDAPESEAARAMLYV